jgi:hypothetical protein
MARAAALTTAGALGLWAALKMRLDLFWFCTVRGLCIVCGKPAPRFGDAKGVCDNCMGVQYDALGAFIEVEEATYPMRRKAWWAAGDREGHYCSLCGKKVRHG